MRSLTLATVATILVAGCAGADLASPTLPASAATPEVSAAPSAIPDPTPNGTPEATPHSTPEPSAERPVSCPTHSPLTVGEYLSAEDAGLACFPAGLDVTIVGWAGTWPDGIGWLAPGVDPDWLALSTSAMSEDKCPKSTEMCGERLDVHYDGNGSIDWKQDGRWVVVTGHTGDPLAETCRPDPPDNGMSNADARRACRESFVLTSVRRATSALVSGTFARVVIPELNVRERPSTSARVLQEPVPDSASISIRLGTASKVDDVYILDGPVTADGYRWWLVEPTEYALDDVVLPTGYPDTERSPGWVADGSGKDAWLVPAENPCPPSPVRTADVTLKAASWAVRLGCFSGQTLTLRGWYAWNEGITAIFPGMRSWDDPANHDRLDLRLFPSTLVMPPPDQWLDVTGVFDHPSAATCDSWEVLACRSIFTVTEVVALGP